MEYLEQMIDYKGGNEKYSFPVLEYCPTFYTFKDHRFKLSIPPSATHFIPENNVNVQTGGGTKLMRFVQFNRKGSKTAILPSTLFL